MGTSVRGNDETEITGRDGHKTYDLSQFVLWTEKSKYYPWILHGVQPASDEVQKSSSTASGAGGAAWDDLRGSVGSREL